MIQVTKVKKVFHDAGVQLSTDAINMIRDDMNRQIRLMTKSCKAGNIKRLTAATYHLALGKYEQYLKGK